MRTGRAYSLHGLGFERQLRDELGLDTSVPHTGKTLQQSSDSFKSHVDFSSICHFIKRNQSRLVIQVRSSTISFNVV